MDIWEDAVKALALPRRTERHPLKKEEKRTPGVAVLADEFQI